MFTPPLHIAASILAAAGLFFQGFAGGVACCRCAFSPQAKCCSLQKASAGICFARDAIASLSLESPSSPSAPCGACSNVASRGEYQARPLSTGGSRGCCGGEQQSSSAEHSPQGVCATTRGVPCRCRLAILGTRDPLADTLRHGPLRPAVAQAAIFTRPRLPEAATAALPFRVTSWDSAGPSLQSLYCVWRE